MLSADCNNQNATVGCGVLAPNNNPSFGQAFNQNGGGVWATQFDETGILYVSLLVLKQESLTSFLIALAFGSGM